MSIILAIALDIISFDSYSSCSEYMLVVDLLSEGYEYVMVGRLQSDPLERRFSQYRQMSGGRFLVGLGEVIVPEKILACR